MKKLISFILTAAIISTTVLLLNGCHNSSDKTGSSNIFSDINKGFVDASFFESEKNPDLKISVDSSELKLIKQQVERFKKHYSDNLNISITVYDKNDNAEDEYKTSTSDFYFISSGLLHRFSEMLLPIDNELAEFVKADNVKIMTDDITTDNKLYTFPVSYDTSYYLTYDKSVVSDKDAQTLESILSACKKSDKQFVMNVETGFISSSFTLTGGIIPDGFEYDESEDSQKIKNYDEDEAVKTLMAFSSLMKKYRGTFVKKDYDSIEQGYKNKTVAAAVSSFFTSNKEQKALGDNFGVEKLPTVNVNGTDKQMISMYGFRYLGIKKETRYPKAAQALAYYLNSEVCQRERMQQLGSLPSNLAVQKEAVKNPAMAALLEQSKYSVPMVKISNNYWHSMEGLGTTLYKDDWNPDDKKATTKLLEETIKEAKDEY